MIPVSRPDITAKEEEYVSQAVKSTWVSSTGEFVDRFEREFAEVCDARFALSVCNGTVALHLALLALGVGPGDEVIVPSLTYVAVANAVTYVGATPVFADVDKHTWCIDPEHIAKLVTSRTKGIIAVHLYGICADMKTINRIASRNGLWVVEDAAEAHFALYEGRPVGALGTVGTFSFYGNKVITSGEGGAVVTNIPWLAKKMEDLRGQGADRGHRFFFPIIGHNFRLTNVACALLCAQLERSHDILTKRRLVYEKYRERLDGAHGICLQNMVSYCVYSPWLFPILTDIHIGIGRDLLMDLLAKADVETRPFFYPLHKLPAYESIHLARGYDLQVTEELSELGLLLPTYPGLQDVEIDHICSVIKRQK